MTGFVPVAAAAGAVGGLADSGLFVWLTRGRLWIGLLGTLLVGIVGLNVMALSFSASSSTVGQQADALRRENSALRAQIATSLSTVEIQAAASKLDLVNPPPGSIGYLRPSPDDAAKAAHRLRDGELTAPTYVAPVATAPVAPAESTVVAPDPTVVATDPEVAVADPAATAPAETATPPATEPTVSAGAVGAP